LKHARLIALTSLFIHSFILDISIALLQRHNYTQRRSRIRYWYSVGVSAPEYLLCICNTCASE